MKYSGTPAQTSRLTAGLGGSRRPSSMWIVFRTTFSPRGSTSWPLLPRGTHSACRSWRNTFPFLHRLRSPALIRSPSLPPFLGGLGGAFTPPFLGGLGGAFTPSDRRLSRFSTSLRVYVPRVGVRNLIPSLKNTPHHALTVSSHRLHMGGALAPVAVSPLCPSPPPWGMGGAMTAVVVHPRHILTVRLAAIHRGHLTSTRVFHPLLSEEDLIHRTSPQRAARILRSGAAPPPTRRWNVLLPLGKPRSPPPCLRALSPFPPWRPSLFLRSRMPPTTFKRAILSFTGSVARAILLHAPTPLLSRTRGTPLPASSGRA